MLDELYNLLNFKPFSKTKALSLVCIIVASLFSSVLLADSFYVATDGNNSSGDGSQANPWANISFAIDQVVDGSTIEVEAGTYTGRVNLDRKFQTGVLIRSSSPYQAKLRHNNGAVVTCFSCQGITLEGFDIAHSASNNIALVIQIQTVEVSNVTLRNNIIHDSTNNDLLKINNGARDVLVQGNIFYNQAGSDEHIDINSVIGVTVLDNVFFNSASQAVTSSYIVVKDSNGNSDGVLGSEDISIRRNVFLNWQGNDGQSFVRVGEDGTANFEAQNVLIENNLMIGNSSRLMRSAFTVQGSRDIRFQFNTVVGDLPARSFAARLLAVGQNRPNENIVLSNNIWSDPAGTMGTEGFIGADVFDAPNGDNLSVQLDNNLYFNGGNAIPGDSAQQVNIDDDLNAVIADPGLPAQNGLVLPVYNGSQFGGGLSTIRQVLVDLANRFGKPAAGSAAIDHASNIAKPADDLLGASRGSAPDIGAIEVGGTGNPDPPEPPKPGKNTILSWLMLLLD